MDILTLNTLAASGIASGTATLNGEVTHVDRSAIDAAAAFFEYGQQPDLSDAVRTAKDKESFISNETGGTYSHNLSGLTKETGYYYQAKARTLFFKEQESRDYIFSAPVSWPVIRDAAGAVHCRAGLFSDPRLFGEVNVTDSRIEEFYTSLLGGPLHERCSFNPGVGLGYRCTTNWEVFGTFDVDFTDVQEFHVTSAHHVRWETLSVEIDGVAKSSKADTTHVFTNVGALSGVYTVTLKGREDYANGDTFYITNMAAYY